MPGTVRPRPGRRSPLCPHTGRARAGPETQPFLGAPTGPHSHGCQASPLGLSLSFKPLDVCPGSSLHAHDLSPRNSVVYPPHFSLRVPSRRWGLVMLRSIKTRRLTLWPLGDCGAKGNYSPPTPNSRSRPAQPPALTPLSPGTWEEREPGL